MAWLLIETPDGQRRQYKLGELDSGFGRAKANAVPLSDQKCSSFHCLIKPQRGGRYAVVDAGSRNGTRVNDEPLDEGEERLLAEGDVISLGQTRVSYSEATLSPDREALRILNPEETAAAIAAGETAVQPVVTPGSASEASETDASTTAEVSTTFAPPPQPVSQQSRETEVSARTPEETQAGGRTTMSATVSPAPDATTLPPPHVQQRQTSLRLLAMVSATVAFLAVAAFAFGARFGANASNESQPHLNRGDATVAPLPATANGNNLADHPGEVPPGNALAQELAELRREHRTTQRLLARLEERQATQLAEQATLVDEFAEHLATMQQSVLAQDETEEFEHELLQIHQLLLDLHAHLELDGGLDLTQDSATAERNPTSHTDE